MRKVFRGVALAYLMYLALSFLVLLPALNFLTPWLVRHQLQHTLSTELILFNPFSLTLEIRNAELVQADGSRLLAFDRSQVNFTLATLWRPGLVFDALALDGLYLHLLRRPDGQFNIADLMPARETAAEPAPDADKDLPGLTIGALRFSAHRIEFTDQQHPQGYQSYLEGLRLEASGLSTVVEAGQAYHLVVSSEGGGELEWQGDVSIAAGHSAGELALRDIDLRPVWRFAEPWLAFELERSLLNLEARYHIDWSGALRYGIDQGRLELRDSVITAADPGRLGISLGSLQVEGIAVAGAEIDGGQARSTGTLALQGFAPDRLELDGAIADFSMVLRGADDALTRWDRLSWHGLTLQLAERRLDLAELHLEGYEGRLHILEDGSVNVQRLLEEDAAAAAQADGEPNSAAGDTGRPEQPPWRIAAPAIFVTDSQLDFEDESLPIRFRSVIGDLNGSITDLGTNPERLMKVDLQGSVDGYAPVTLEGTARPLQDPPALDLELDFRGVDMSRLTPYSATYAGYEIERGSLNLTLQYALEDNRLQGDNELVIKQLRLGERVESDRALDLPLRLGIALLTDSNGVIDVSVPVSGDVNNPEFNLGSVITGAFVNLLTSMVTAPFRLLAGLAGSSEDLETVDFAAGSAELDRHGQQKLRDLAAAMQQRPAIKLVLAGQIDAATDHRSLQQQQLQQELLDAGLSVSDINERSAAWEEAIAERYDTLEPDPDPAGETPSILLQARRVLERQPVQAQALAALARERAAASKRFLVNEGGIAADRAVIEDVDPDSDADNFSGVEMAVST